MSNLDLGNVRAGFKAVRHAFWEHIAAVALGMELGGILIYAVAKDSWVAFAILLLLALAATAAGSILGFLFGVPRYRPDATVDGDYAPNTNLEQVSDWLTKVIIGATLVQLHDLAAAIGELSAAIDKEIGDDAGSAIVAGSVLIYSFIGGFVWSYLWTSVRLMKELAKRQKYHGGGDGQPSGDGAATKTTEAFAPTI